MRVVSTRGSSQPISFEEALFTSYCRDGGMTMPESIPQVDVETLEEWKHLSYPDIVKKIMSLYVSQEEVTLQEQSDIIDRAFSTFDISGVVEVRKLKDGLNVMELWHGETLAFKDLAMTCTAQFLSHFLEKRKKKVTIVIITSGDTGSSALYSMKHAPEVSTVVMYPHEMISDVQKLMMTTVNDPTAHVFAVPVELEDMEGFFEQMIADEDFVNDNSIATLNSLNWCRILVQSAHHVYGYLQTATYCGSPINMIIPNGACGNLSACVLAQRMGIPLRPICVTNANDTLHRIVRNNDWSKSDQVATLAPAMNMTFLVNFERILWLLSDRNTDLMKEMMKSYYARKDDLKLPDDLHRKVSAAIQTSVASDDHIKQAMKKCWVDNRYSIDPHTACAAAYFYGYTEQSRDGAVDHNLPTLCISTAAAAKFPEILPLASVPVPRCHKITKLETETEKVEILKKDDNWQKIILDKIRQITSERHASS